MRSLLTACLLLPASIAFSQITYRDASKGADPLRKYDSSFNFSLLIERRQVPGSDEEKWILTDPASLTGQQITFLPRNSRLTEKGAYNFDDTTFTRFLSQPVPIRTAVTDEMKAYIKGPYQYLSVTDPTAGKRQYDLAKNLNEPTKIYKPTLFWNRTMGEVYPRTGYSALENKTFTIQSAKLTSEAAHVHYYDLELRDAEGQIINWTITFDDLKNYKVVMDGYLTKLRTNWLNRNFYMYKSRYGFSKDSYTNPLDQQRYQYADDKKWTCSDVTFLFNEKLKFAGLYLILKDESGFELAVNPQYDEWSSELSAPYLYSEPDYLAAKAKVKADEEAALAARKAEGERLVKENKQFRADVIKRYGTVYGPLIADGKVKLGMTKDMCETAWGYPKNTLTGTAGGRAVEIWMYEDGRSLHFSGNKLFQILQ